MSSVGLSIYEISNRTTYKPQWMRLERIDYCDQDGFFIKSSGWKGLIRLFKRLFH